MLKLFIAAPLALTLAGCAIATTQSDAPVETLMLQGQYQRLAACLYAKRDSETPGQVRITELPGLKQSRVSQELTVSGVLATTAHHRFWEASFIEDSANTTRVEIRAVAHLNQRSIAEIRQNIEACSQR